MNVLQKVFFYWFMTQTGARAPHDGRGHTAAEWGHAEEYRQLNKGEVIFIWTNCPWRMKVGNKKDLTSSVSVKDHHCAHAGFSSQQCSSQSPWKKLFGLHRSGQSKHNVAPVGVHFTANANQLLTLMLWWTPKHRSMTGLLNTLHIEKTASVCAWMSRCIQHGSLQYRTHEESLLQRMWNNSAVTFCFLIRWLFLHAMPLSQLWLCFSFLFFKKNVTFLEIKTKPNHQCHNGMGAFFFQLCFCANET